MITLNYYTSVELSFHFKIDFHLKFISGDDFYDQMSVSGRKPDFVGGTCDGVRRCCCKDWLKAGLGK